MLSRMTVAAIALGLGQVPAPQFNPDWGVIFPTRNVTLPIVQCSREVPKPIGGMWTPDQATIHRLDKVLAPVLQEAIDQERPLPSKRSTASSYYRQYFGLVVDGRQIIYINGFHETYLKLWVAASPGSRPNWRDKPVDACDGWTLFFGAEYDPATHTVQRIRFNGRAG